MVVHFNVEYIGHRDYACVVRRCYVHFFDSITTVLLAADFQKAVFQGASLLLEWESYDSSRDSMMSKGTSVSVTSIT